MRKKKKVILDDDAKQTINYLSWALLTLNCYRKRTKALQPLHRIEVRMSNLADVILDIVNGKQFSLDDVCVIDWDKE